MAMFDRSFTKTIYSQLGNDQDECYFCREVINEQMKEKKISIDERITALRSLRGTLAGKRIMKINFRGTEICVCPECIAKIYLEIFPKIKETETLKEELENTNNKKEIKKEVKKEAKNEKSKESKDSK